MACARGRRVPAVVLDTAPSARVPAVVLDTAPSARARAQMREMRGCARARRFGWRRYNGWSRCTEERVFLGPEVPQGELAGH